MRSTLTVFFCAFAPLLGQAPGTLAGVDRGDLAARYARVEAELRAATPAGLTPAQRAARARVLDSLHRYRLGELNRNVAFPGERKPFFIDDRGQRCAVAYLLDDTGHAELTWRIAARDNHVWVGELAAMPELQQWLQQCGLTLEEAVRIQAPGYSGRNQRQPPPPPATSRGAAPAGPRRNGPGDAAAPEPARGGPASRSGGAPGNASGAPGSAPARGTTPVARGVALAALDAETWSTWWNWNRDAVLPLEPPSQLPVGTTSSAPGIDTAALRELLTAAHPALRAEAALAFAARSGRRAVDALLPLLGDPAAEVRAAAVLGLGSAGGPEATHALLTLAARGHLADDAAAGDANAQLFAVLGLALARGDGERSIGDDVIATLLQRDSAPETLQAAALAYARVTGAASLRPAALELLAGTASPDVRGRAAEALGGRLEVETLRALQDGLSGRSIDVRRSCANALAATRHALALPPLLTAFELEKELYTRALLLVAIGHHGGARGVPFLREQLRSGPKALRGWAALALGLQGRADVDTAAALERFVADCSDQDSLGAALLALGLGRTPNALAMLSARLRDPANDIRGAAVDALCLLGDPNAELPAVLADDSCPWVRSLAAEAIGRLPQADLAALRLAVRGDPDAGVQAAAAAGLGRHGRAVELLALARDDRHDLTRRLAALRGLWHGTAADGRLTRMAAFANFTLYPDWLAWALQRDR